MIQSIDISRPSPFLSSRIVAIIRSSWFSWIDHQDVREEILRLPLEQLNQVIESVLLEENESDAIDRLAELIPLKRLQDALAVAYEHPVDAFLIAQRMMHQARHYFEQTQLPLTLGLSSYVTIGIDAFLAVLEGIISAFGITDVFKTPETDLEAEFKGQRIMMLISLFSSLSAILIPILGAEAVGTMIGVPLLVIMGLSLIYPAIKRLPAILPRAENWSQQAREGSLKEAVGRKSCLDEIAQALIQSKGLKTHVMLLGKSGIGKTETARAFVHALKRGDYPQLQDKEVFYVNMADLVMAREYSTENKSLSKIRDAMGRHRERIILIFDEIHLACQQRENSALADQLKTMLDEGQNTFPLVIGITTDEEYYRDIYANQPAFARRFKRIAIENTSTLETLEIINNTFLKNAPYVLVEPGISELLLDKITKAFGVQTTEPATALRILFQCIQKTAQAQQSPLETQIKELLWQIRFKHSQGGVGQGVGLIANDCSGSSEEIRLQNLEKVWEIHKQEIEALHRTCHRLFTAKVETLKESLRSTEAIESQLGRFLLLSHYLAPALEKRVRDEGSRLGVITSIDGALIDAVIKEEEEMAQRIQETIQSGKKQIAARQ